MLTESPRRYAMDVIRECAEAWERLITGKVPPNGISTFVAASLSIPVFVA